MDDERRVTIEVDKRVAEILRLASERADRNGETLSEYLRHSLGADLGSTSVRVSQERAFEDFVAGVTEWAMQNLPRNHFVDDSREAMYDDRI